MGKFTIDDFISNSIKIHGDIFDYSQSEYINTETKLKIICKKCGYEFFRDPHIHLRGQGCFKCFNTNRTCTTEAFIKKAKEIHGDKYDYSLVNYINNYIKIKIICPKHGIFEQKPNHHLHNHGCAKCYDDDRFYNSEEFINKSISIHGDRYDYSLVDYVDSNSNVKIICKKHGIFEQKPFTHLADHGCPKCHTSKGERDIEQFLKDNNINYIPQKTFDGCINKKLLPFDFYLPDCNICIEYDGVFHYEPVFGEDKLKMTKFKDNIRTLFCSNNGIKLIRIGYKENLYEKLKEIKSSILL